MNEQDGFRRSALQLGLLLLAVSGALAVLMTGKGPEDILKQRRAALPVTESECSNKGGAWKRTPFGGEYCSMQLEDAGTVCEDIRDCQGLCLAASSTHNPLPYNACSRELVLFGCYAEFNHDVRKICRD
jgi:hypothetical protein